MKGNWDRIMDDYSQKDMFFCTVHFFFVAIVPTPNCYRQHLFVYSLFLESCIPRGHIAMAKLV